MENDLLMFFNKMPQAQPLFDTFVRKLTSVYDGLIIRVQKSQISFANKHSFAFVWLPTSKIKGRPDVYIIISFGLDHQLLDPRIEEAAEAYPNRWTHHVIIENESEIDEQLMGWIKQAHDFALKK